MALKAEIQMAQIDSAGAIRRTHATERRAKISEVLILGVLFFFLFQYGVQWYRISQALKIDGIKVSEPRVVSPTNLCPGDELIVRYALTVQGFGIVIADGATYFDGQPVTFSESERVPPSDGPTTIVLTHKWIVPDRPDFMIHGAEAWIPGQYTRQVTLAASTLWVSRFVDPQSFDVQFAIRKPEECIHEPE